MSEFTGNGFETFPSIHVDNKRVAEFSEWTTPVLEEHTSQYAAFLQRDDLMPRARAQAERVLDHLLFELAYRDGIYDEFIEKNDVCEEAPL